MAELPGDLTHIDTEHTTESYVLSTAYLIEPPLVPPISVLNLIPPIIIHDISLYSLMLTNLKVI